MRAVARSPLQAISVVFLLIAGTNIVFVCCGIMPPIFGIILTSILLAFVSVAKGLGHSEVRIDE